MVSDPGQFVHKGFYCPKTFDSGLEEVKRRSPGGAAQGSGGLGLGHELSPKRMARCPSSSLAPATSRRRSVSGRMNERR